MKNKFNYTYYCKHLLKFDYIMVWVNLIVSLVMILLLGVIMYHNYLNILLLVIIPTLGLDIFESLDCLGRCHSYSDLSAYSKLLQYSYIFMAACLFFALLTIFLNNPLILPISLVFMVISFTFLYYIWHPVYINKQLSLNNMFHSTSKPLYFFELLFTLPEFILFLILILGYYVMHVLSHLNKVIKIFNHRGILIKSVYVNNTLYFKSSKFTTKYLKPILIKRYRLSHNISLSRVNNLTNYDDIKCLKIIMPRLDNIFINVLLYTCAILLLLLISLIILSLIYSSVNKIYKYKAVNFDIKLAVCIFKFPLLVAPSFYILKKIIMIFEKNPSGLSMGAVFIIIFFFPFMISFYILYTINSLNKIKV